jgi:hypothetical protein
MPLIGRNLAIGLVAGLLIGATLTYALAGPFVGRTFTATSLVTTTSLATTTSTSTIVTTQEITVTTTQAAVVTNYSSIETIQGTGSESYDISGYGTYFANHTSDGVWNFSLALSGLDTYEGFDAYVKLTNISNQTQNIRVANPLINPMLYCTNGPACGISCAPGSTCGTIPPGAKPAWAWNPPNVTLVNMTLPPGGWYFSGPYPIEDRNLQESDYVLSVWPLVEPSGSVGGGYSIGQSLTINATLGQSLNVDVPISVS